MTFRRSFSVGALALVLAALAPSGARAAQKKSVPDPILSSTCTFVPCASTQAYTVQPPPVFDRFHMRVSRAFVGPIAWFDGFFFPEHAEVETNRSYLRAITGYEWVNGKGFSFRKALRAKVRVPGIKKRLNLLFSDDDETDFEQPTRTRTGAVTRRNTNETIRDATDRRRAGLGYTVFDYVESRIDVETALRSHARAELSTRFRQNFPVFNATKGRFTVTGFWLQRTGFGSRARLGFERPVADDTIIHFENAVTQIHAVPGVVLEHRFSYDWQISEHAGLSPGIGMNGSTRPVTRADAYFASVVYRRNFHRTWLFYEVEPGINWTRDIYGAYPPIMTTAFRLEVQFRTTTP